MLRIAAEFQDVPLCNAHVLEQLPRRMRRAFDLFATQLRRQPAHGIIKASVSALEAEQVQ